MTRDERTIAICAAYEAGASLSQVAERFGLSNEGVRKVLLRNGRAARSRREGVALRYCDPEFVRRRSEAARERMKALHADPEFARRNSECASERMKALNADPEFARRQSERMKALNSDPEFACRNREAARKRMKALNSDPLRNPLVTLTPAQRAVYDRLKRKGCNRDEALVEARRPILGEAAE